MKPKPKQKEEEKKKKKNWMRETKLTNIAFEIIGGWFFVEKNSPKRPTWHTHNDIESLIYIGWVKS